MGLGEGDCPEQSLLLSVNQPYLAGPRVPDVGSADSLKNCASITELLSFPEARADCGGSLRATQPNKVLWPLSAK